MINGNVNTNVNCCLIRKHSACIDQIARTAVIVQIYKIFLKKKFREIDFLSSFTVIAFSSIGDVCLK